MYWIIYFLVVAHFNFFYASILQHILFPSLTCMSMWYRYIVISNASNRINIIKAKGIFKSWYKYVCNWIYILSFMSFIIVVGGTANIVLPHAWCVFQIQHTYNICTWHHPILSTQRTAHASLRSTNAKHDHLVFIVGYCGSPTTHDSSICCCFNVVGCVSLRTHERWLCVFGANGKCPHQMSGSVVRRHDYIDLSTFHKRAFRGR